MSQYSLDGNWTMPSVNVPQVRSATDALLNVAPTTAAQIWRTNPIPAVTTTPSTPQVLTTTPTTVTDSPSIFGKIGDFISNGWNKWFGSSSTTDPWETFLGTHNLTLDQFGKLDSSLQSSLLKSFDQQQALQAMDKYGGIGWNLGTAKLGFDILGGLGSWVQGNKNLQFARDQLDWQKNAWQQQFDLAKEDRDRAIQDRDNNRRAFSGM